MNSFLESLSDDFNTPQALASIFEFMGKIQPYLWNLSYKASHRAIELVEGALETVGIRLPKQSISIKARFLAAKRERHRKNKQFIQSDALRKKLDELGYIVEDTPKGPLLFKPIYATRTIQDSIE